MEIKRDSSKWINQSNFLLHRFDWQEGYGAFSSSKSALITVIEYIKNQEDHHKKHTLFDEYKQLYDKYEIEYNDKYLYKFLDTILLRDNPFGVGDLVGIWFLLRDVSIGEMNCDGI